MANFFETVEGSHIAVENRLVAERALNQISFFVFVFEHVFKTDLASRVLRHAQHHGH